MTFVEHSILWAKGEIFEGTLIAIAGISFLLLGLALWKFGSTEGARAFIIPITVTGFIFVASGVSSYYSNSKRIEVFKESFSVSSSAFLLEEKKRVEGFQYLYKYTKWAATIFFVVAIVTQFLSVSVSVRAFGITLAIIGIAGLAVDYFSKERADTYYSEILKFSNSASEEN